MPASGRGWGRAGVVLIASVALVTACNSAPRPSLGAARSVGAEGRADASTDGSAPPFVPPSDETAIPTAPETFSGAPAPALPPAPQLAQPVAAESVPTGTGVWAVVIGINNYPGTSHDLESARNDATDMDTALARYRVPSQQRVLLYDGQATADVIRRSLNWLAGNAGPDATALFFYAGHVRKLAAHSEAMVGADGRTVTDTEVAQRLSRLRAGRTWLVIAACYGGGFNEALGPGRILTAAAPANEVAYENSSLHRSYLGEYLTHQAILEGHADGSVEDAFAWAWAGIQRDHPNRLPVQYDQVPGKLVLGPQPAPVKPQSSPGPTPSPQPTTTTTTAPPRNDGKQCLVSASSLITC